MKKGNMNLKSIFKGSILILFSGIIIITTLFVLYKKKIIELPFLENIGFQETSYHMPVFSSDGEGIAYIQIDRGKKQEPVQYNTAICTVDLFGKHRKKSVAMQLGKFEEPIIKDFNYKEGLLSLQTINYPGDLRTDYLCNLNTSEYKNERQQKLSSYNQLLSDKSGSNEKIIIENPDNDKNVSSGRIDYQKEDGTKVSVMTTASIDESFQPLGWINSGNDFLFQFHTVRNFIYYNQLWKFSHQTGNVKEVASDSFNVISSRANSIVAFLVPQCRAKNGDIQDRDSCKNWQLIVRNLDEVSGNLILQKNYEGDIELYAWSADGSGFIYSRESTLCYYDVNENSDRELLNSLEDGWWGCPLSPYYIAISNDKKKIAVLTYKYTNSDNSTSRQLTEHLILIDLKNPSKKVISKEVFSTGKIQFLFNFHQRIAWSGSDEYIVFEGRNRKSPELTDIFLISADGSRKNNISRPLFGLFGL